MYHVVLSFVLCMYLCIDILVDILVSQIGFETTFFDLGYVLENRSILTF